MSQTQLKIQQAIKFVGCRVHLGANQTFASAAFTKVTLNTKDYDIGSNFDATTNYRFTAPATGYYRITAHAKATGFTTGYRLIVNIFKNGAVWSDGQTNPGSTNDVTVEDNDLLYLASGDYIEMYVYQNTGANQTLYAGSQADTWITIQQVG